MIKVIIIVISINPTSKLPLNRGWHGWQVFDKIQKIFKKYDCDVI